MIKVCKDEGEMLRNKKMAFMIREEIKKGEERVERRR